jgi:hypothetical protein
MKEFFTSYQYLCSLMVWLFFYAIGLIIFYRYRKSIFFSSFLALPQAFFAILLVPTAWQPNRIFVFGAGIEDLLFCFLSGGLVWMSVLWIYRKNVPQKFQLRNSIKRFVYCTVFGVLTVSLILLFTRLRGYIIPFTIMILWCTIVLIYKPGYLKLFLTGIASFLVVWFFVLLIIINIWPDMPSLWSWDKLWGLSFFKFPVEELVWAILYGGSWSLTMAFILNIEIDKK